MSISSSKIFNIISYTKEKLSVADIDNYYISYIINRMVAQYPELIVFAEYMNRYHNIDKYDQFLYYCQIIPKSKRKVLWIGREKNDDIDIISEYYCVSYTKAMEYYKILDSDQIDVLREKINEGGRE